jgi:hypothetical protein
LGLASSRRIEFSGQGKIISGKIRLRRRFLGRKQVGEQGTGSNGDLPSRCGKNKE